MTRTVTYFPLQCARNSGPVVTAAVQALTQHGFKVQTNNLDADVAMIWSVLWAGRMAANQQVYQLYRNTGRPVICIEVGALARGITWKIALNHVTADGIYGHRENLDWDRPRKLGLALKNKTVAHDRILVAAQHNLSQQLQGVDQESWYVDKIHEVAQGRTVVVRPHPRCPLNRDRFPSWVQWQQPAKLANTYDSFDINWDYDTVINYNSGPGIQAVIEDIPAVTHRSSLAHAVQDRQQWLTEISHTEYTVPEIQSGTWVKRIGLDN